MESRLQLDAVYRAVDHLPEEQRTALLLVYVEGYSYSRSLGDPGNPDRNHHEPPGAGPSRPCGTDREPQSAYRQLSLNDFNACKIEISNEPLR